MYSFSADQSEPINRAHEEKDKKIEEKSQQASQTLEYQYQRKEEKPKCLLHYTKKAYLRHLTVFFALFMVIVAFQICSHFYLHSLRAEEYEHNLQLLGKYTFEGKAIQKGTEISVNTLDRSADKLLQQFVKQDTSSRGSKNIQPTKIQEALTSHSKEQVQIRQSPAEKETSGQAQKTLNNHFEFESSLLQDNLKLSTNAPLIAFQPIPDVAKPEEDQQIPSIVYKNLQSKNDKIDYQQFTGITVGQLQKTKIFTQIKFFSLTQSSHLVDQQREYYENKYKVSQYQQLPICVVIPTYNNAVKNRHINNMNSILMQEYSNYHIVFIDDASTDSTSEDIIQLMNSQKKLDPSKYLLIKNRKQMKAMYNLRNAANTYCNPQDIFIIVDGDDQLIGRQVFKLFNAMFQSTGAWFVYSNFLTVQNYVGFSRLIPKQVIQKNDYRKYPFVTSHLRAFYTQLFRNIKEEDLRDKEGEYLKAANDVAICIPILQQAQNRVLYVPEITYFYNSQTGLNNHYLRLKQQKRNDYRLRAKPKYKRLQNLMD